MSQANFFACFYNEKLFCLTHTNGHFYYSSHLVSFLILNSLFFGVKHCSFLILIQNSKMFNNNFLLHLTNQVTWDHAKRDVAEG